MMKLNKCPTCFQYNLVFDAVWGNKITPKVKGDTFENFEAT